MTCTDALHLVEAIAAGDLEVDETVRAHFETGLGRIRQERWRSEERIDRVFNVAIVVAVLLVVGSVAALTNVDAVLGGARSLWGLMAAIGGHALQTAAPMLLTYVAAAGLLMSALAMWWWADRRLSL